MSTQYLLSFSGDWTPSTLFSSLLPRPHNSDRITNHSPHPICSGGVKGPGWTNHMIGSRSEQVLIWFLSGIIYVDVERELSLPSRVPRWDDGSLELLMVVILTSLRSALSWGSSDTKGERGPHRKRSQRSRGRIQRERERERETPLTWLQFLNTALPKAVCSLFPPLWASQFPLWWSTLSWVSVIFNQKNSNTLTSSLVCCQDEMRSFQ